MQITQSLSIALAIVVGGSVYTLVAQQPAAPPQPMSFFITSVGMGDGANLKGLAGADAHCQMLATAAGRGTATWRAYLARRGLAPRTLATASARVRGTPTGE